MDDELYESVRRAILEGRGEQLDERVTNPYAVGMAAAMKATGDRPPLKKSTIVKAHRIAKKIKEEVEEVEEGASRSFGSAIKKAEASRQRAIKRAGRSVHKGQSVENAIRDHDLFAKDKDAVLAHAASLKKIKEEVEQVDEFAPLLATAARAALPAIGRAVGTSAAGKIGQSAATRAVGGAIGSAVGQNVANRMTSNTSSSSSTTYEEKDSREYDYEGEMVLTQIRMINHHLDELQNILKPDTNLPEWVQAKLTLATDYIQTVTDYMKSEMSEEAELGEASTHEKNKQHIEVTSHTGHRKLVPVHPLNAYKALNHYRGLISTKSARIVSEMSEEVEIVEGVEVSTSTYEFSHGKKPKGSGGWMFSPHKNPDMKTQKDDVFSTHGSYTDAKKKAAAWAKGKGHRTIHALPEEVELDEARGRPKKDKGYTVHPVTKELLHHDNPAHMARIKTLRRNKILPPEKKEPSEHIINRMGQAATNMTGGQHIKYDNGKTHHVSNSLASRTLAHYRGLKPADKEKFQDRIAQSHEDHLDALQGK